MISPNRAPAELTISFTPIEEAKFLFKGADWADTDSVQLTVAYDTTYLTAPEATIMGGIIQHTTIQSAEPGRLQLRVRSDGLSPNFEICIFFQKLGEYPAVINFVTAEATSLTGIVHHVPVLRQRNPNAPQLPPTAENSHD
jgi:hypothetical protein